MQNQTIGNGMIKVSAKFAPLDTFVPRQPLYVTLGAKRTNADKDTIVPLAHQHRLNTRVQQAHKITTKERTALPIVQSVRPVCFAKRRLVCSMTMELFHSIATLATSAQKAV